MNHYVCSGECQGSSDTPGVCQSDTCSRFEKPLIECDCADATHPGIQSACKDCGSMCKVDGGCQMDSFKEELVA